MAQLKTCFTTLALTAAWPLVAAADCAALHGFLSARPQALPGSECGEITTEAGSGLACHTSYPYRATAAQEALDTQWRLIRACAPDAIEQPTPVGVNHPDTHHVRVFYSEERQITLSLKDKAAAGKTFVFLISAPR